MLDFRKAEVGTAINFAKDLDEPVLEGVITFNLNWGKVNGQSVDLDAVARFEARNPSPDHRARTCLGRIKENLFGREPERKYQDVTIYYGNLGTQGVLHHGDDLTGSWAKGEYIEIDLGKIDPRIDTITLGVLSYSGHAFNTLPFASISVFTGPPTAPRRGVVETELVNFESRTKSVVMAQLKRNSMGEWTFMAHGIELTGHSVSALSQSMRKL